jgi:hypothetical protein
LTVQIVNQIDIPVEDDLSVVDEEKDSLINKSASLLVSIDKRAHLRTLLRDANAILENLLVPMSFPWAHRIEPIVRTIPRDIDDVLRTYEDEEDMPPTYCSLEEHDGEANEDYSSGRNSQLRSEARRSKDPGVVELTGFHAPAVFQRKPVLAQKKRKRGATNDSVPGELSFRMYEEVRQRKLQRLSLMKANTITSFLSVRFGGVSSRSTLFDDVGNGRTPLLLPVLLPREVSAGKHVNISHAKDIATSLGTYDCRYGCHYTEKAVKIGERAPRSHAGRTRLLWTAPAEREKGKSVSPKSRQAYRSLITGEMVENGAHKRPRSVLLGIRVNGILLTAPTETCTSPSSLQKTIRRTSPLKTTLSADTSIAPVSTYSPGIVKMALDDACS